MLMRRLLGFLLSLAVCLVVITFGRIEASLGQVYHGMRSTGLWSEPGACPEEPADSGDNRVHVIYCTNVQQLEGVLASAASAIQASSRSLSFHIMVQPQHLPTFRKKVGVRPNWAGRHGPKGAFVRLHQIDDRRVVVGRIGTLYHDSRTDLNALENWARFHLFEFLGPIVAIYLDADTIVQGDLALLRDILVESGKPAVIASVRIQNSYRFRIHPKKCKLKFPFPAGTDVKALKRRKEPNAGVFAVDLKKWEEKNISGRIHVFMATQESCNGTAYDGGNQVPMMLALLARPRWEEPDAVEVSDAWNLCGVGSVPNLDTTLLQSARVLHWNGPAKPWLRNGGLHFEYWSPHREAFGVMFPPDTG